MRLFDRYLAVDWSANNSPKRGMDSIWIAERGPGGAAESVNPPTRVAAMAHLTERLQEARAGGERVFVGFDFPFGYPAGAVARLGAGETWQALWDLLDSELTDGADNRSNRFEVAARLNARLGAGGPQFWGCPAHLASDWLSPTKKADYSEVAEFRVVERVAKGAKSTWQLAYSGSVGSQCLLGLKHLSALRRHSELGAEIAIWPFETDFERRIARPIVLAEIYPSLEGHDEGVTPKDRAQVEAQVRLFADLDAAGRLRQRLSLPAAYEVHRERLLAEEGWIVGAGQDGASSQTYLRDPDAIYAQSFATIREEADLSGLDPRLHPPAIRMMHASGMVEIAGDIIGSPELPEAARAALAAGAPVLCDCEMVRSGIIRRFLPSGTELVVTLDHPRTAELAKTLATTRSAAAVDLWRERLGGAVVVIGNAPTALFHLLEMLEAGAPRPAAIIAVPVGFVGAAESKALLATTGHNVPFLTLRGRRGGSAMASAAFNAIARGADA